MLQIWYLDRMEEVMCATQDERKILGWIINTTALGIEHSCGSKLMGAKECVCESFYLFLTHKKL